MSNMKCSIHEELFTHYCVEDSTCICVSCHLVGEHKGHHRETLDEAYKRKKQKLKNDLLVAISKREKTELQQENLQTSWNKVVAEADKVTLSLKEVKKQLEDAENEAEAWAGREAALISDVMLQKDELSGKIDRLEDLCNMTDPLSILLESNLGGLSCPDQGGEGRDNLLKFEKDFICYSLMEDSVKHVGDVIQGFNVAFFKQNRSRSPMCLDRSTAANTVTVSEDLKTVTESDQPDLPDTEETDQEYPRVLSVNSFSSGRHYFDVDVCETTEWFIGLCYPSIEQVGEEAGIGQSQKAWCLRVYISSCYAMHGGDSTDIFYYEYNNIRVYVDYEAGQISFYELGDVTKHLHTFTATFTEPLHAVFGVWNGSALTLGEVVSFDK